MDINEIVETYFSALAEGGRVSDYMRSTHWTLRATAALLHAGVRAFPQGVRAAKNHRDCFRRSEYLTLDATITDPSTWAPPLFVAEHENSTWKWKVQYCAWKLLAVEARRRVLVAYFGKGSEFATFDGLRDAVNEVCIDNPGKDILLIGGDYAAAPTNVDDLRAAHATAIVGSHPVR